MLLLLMQWSHHCCNSNNNNDNNDYCNNYNGIDNNLKVMIHCYYNFLNLVLLFLVLFLFATPQEKKNQSCWHHAVHGVIRIIL